MTTGIQYNGTDLASIFGAKGASTAAATGILVNGSDLNTQLMALADGESIGFATGIKVNGTDLESIFGKPIPNTPLSINGDQFISVPTRAGGLSTSVVNFTFNNASFAITGCTSNPTGSIPAGATQCEIIVTHIGGSTSNTTITNPFPSFGSISGTNVALTLHLSSSQPTPLNENYSVQIQFKNSSGVVYSNSTFNINMVTSAT